MKLLKAISFFSTVVILGACVNGCGISDDNVDSNVSQYSSSSTSKVDEGQNSIVNNDTEKKDLKKLVDKKELVGTWVEQDWGDFVLNQDGTGIVDKNNPYYDDGVETNDIINWYVTSEYTNEKATYTVPDGWEGILIMDIRWDDGSIDPWEFYCRMKGLGSKMELTDIYNFTDLQIEISEFTKK